MGTHIISAHFKRKRGNSFGKPLMCFCKVYGAAQKAASPSSRPQPKSRMQAAAAPAQKAVPHSHAGHAAGRRR